MSLQNIYTLSAGVDEASRKKLFWGCFMVLVASAFGFVFRSFLMADWGVQFNLSKTQQGEIFGVSFWPFGISIVIFSLIIDKIGYKKAMIFAFISHILSVVLTILATGYWMLYFVQDNAKKDALRTVCIFPVIMLVCYLGLFFYYRSKGGYKPVSLEHEEPPLLVGEI